MKKTLLAYLLGITFLLGVTSCEKDEKFDDNKFQGSIQSLSDEVTNFEAEILSKQIKLEEGLVKKAELEVKVDDEYELMLNSNIDNVADLVGQIDALKLRLEDCEQDLYLNRAAEIKMILDGINREDADALGLTDRLTLLENEYETLLKHINDKCYLDAIEILNSLEEGIREIAELVPPTWVGDVTLANIDDFFNGGFGAIAGDLNFDSWQASNPQTDFSMLANLVYVAGDVYLGDIYGATDLSGLEKLREVGGNFDIVWCEDVTSLNGLQNLEAIGGIFNITELLLLQDMSALSNLQSCGSLSLSGVGVSSLEGFNNITELNQLLLTWLNNLTSLDGLDNLQSVNDLNLYGNDKLSNIDALSKVSEVSVNVVLHSNSALTSLSGLSSLTSVGGYFSINESPLMNDLKGLENLSSVKDGIIIGGTDISKKMLNSLEGLNNLAYTSRDITITNTNITNLDALSNLNMATRLNLAYNSNLNDFCGLNSSLLNTPGLYVSFSNNAYNPTLMDLIDGNCSN